jgi:hypothetical protein
MERLIPNLRVAGSNPAGVTTFPSKNNAFPVGRQNDH